MRYNWELNFPSDYILHRLLLKSILTLTYDLRYLGISEYNDHDVKYLPARIIIAKHTAICILKVTRMQQEIEMDQEDWWFVTFPSAYHFVSHIGWVLNFTKLQYLVKLYKSTMVLVDYITLSKSCPLFLHIFNNGLIFTKNCK